MAEAGDLAKWLFDVICEDVDRRQNPNDEECWHCGGEGYVADCIDGFCVDAESGCAACVQRCRECVINAGARAREIRVEVIKLGDVDVAREWLKSIDRWKPDISTEHLAAELEKARAELASAEKVAS